MAGKGDPEDDEFDSLYPDADFDDESLAQAEFFATQQVQQHRASQQPARRNGSPAPIHNGSLAPLLPPTPRKSTSQRTPPKKRQRLELSQGTPLSHSLNSPDDDDLNMPEVMWVEGAGYVQADKTKTAITSSQGQPEQRPGPGDFQITHKGPGRPPALGAGHGQSLHRGQWHQQAEQSQLPAAVTQVLAARPSRSANGVSSNRNFQHDSEMNLGGGRTEAVLEERQEMQVALQNALAELKERTMQGYKKDGEVKMVRERNEKFERELAEMRLLMQRQQAEFQKQLEERDKIHAAEKDRVDTTAAFQRLEQETSAKRTIWPTSVRRRTRATDGSQNPASASQYVAPPVGPTTPTKRQKSGSQATPSRSGSTTTRPHRSDDRTLDESPSRARRNALQRSVGSSRGGPTPGTKQFAGFDNSFADLPVLGERKSARAAAQSRFEDQRNGLDLMQVDDQNVDPRRDRASQQAIVTPEPERVRETDPSPDLTTQLTESCRVRYAWTITWFARRRAKLTALLLAHTAPRPAAPLTLPASIYLGAAVPSPELMPDHPSTLHRLLDTQPPVGTRVELLEYHRLATALLLTTVTNGASINDGERRFAFLLQPHDGPPPVDEDALASIEETLYWECEEAAFAGMEDLYEDLAVALRVLMAVYLRLCMLDALQDVMALMLATILIEPSFVNHLVMPELPYQLEVPVKGDAQEDKSQAVAPAGATQMPVDAGRRMQHDPPLPEKLNACLIECVRIGSRALPLTLVRPASLSEAKDLPPGHEDAANGSLRGTQARRAKAKRDKLAKQVDDEPWDAGHEQRESLLETTLELLELIVWTLGDQVADHIKGVFEAPGFIATFLDARRPAPTMRRFLRLLTSLAQLSNFWKTLVACRLDKALQPTLPTLITTSRTPLLEILSKHLVDLRSKQKPSDAHDLHCGVIFLLSQLTIRHDDALLMARQSKSILAALVQSIHMDTSYVWNDDGCGLSGRDNRQQDVCNRITMDVRLLAHIYGPSDVSDSAADGMGNNGGESLLLTLLNAHESHLLLNGIRHCFILAFSRLAFAEEPSWLEEACVKNLQSVADVCSDLLEVVLSPEEVEGAWEICAANGSEADADEGRSMDDEMQLAGEFDPRPN